MELVETEFEILRISKPVGLTFDGLDFVYEALHRSPSQSADIEVVEKSDPVGAKGLAGPYECLYPGVHGIAAPYGRELLCLFVVIFFPKKPQSNFIRQLTEQ